MGTTKKRTKGSKHKRAEAKRKRAKARARATSGRQRVDVLDESTARNRGLLCHIMGRKARVIRADALDQLVDEGKLELQE
jgi:hypothetical protein